jgi:uncharacterized protein YjbJ (UPF0337 family)
MDKDRMKGKMDDIKGRVERQVGEWTGDEDAQAKGTMDQAKGKVQNTFGKAKDAVRDMADDVKDRNRHDEEIRRDQREKDDRAA